MVAADGSRRLLGDYAEASWSPHGLYAVVTRGHELAAVEPDGTPRWTLTRPGQVALARWNGPDGFRIAYLEGRALRVVNGDGTGDRFIAGGAAAVAPAWRSGPGHEVAYATQRGAVVAFAADSRRRIFATAPSAGLRRRVSGTTSNAEVTSLQWSGTRLLVTREDRVELLGSDGGPAWTWTPPAGSHVRSATAAPGGDRVAVVTGDGHTSQVLLIVKAHRSRVLFAGPGDFAAPAGPPKAAGSSCPGRAPTSGSSSSPAAAPGSSTLSPTWRSSSPPATRPPRASPRSSAGAAPSTDHGTSGATAPV